MQMNQIDLSRSTSRKSTLGGLLALITLLAPFSAARAQNGTWTNLVSGDASGSWAAAANWNNSVIANGADSTADFSTLELTATSTVTLDGARTIGNLSFGDTTPDANWALTTGSGGSLTLDVTAGSPTITANTGTSNIITAVLASGTGLTKAGAGTLRLNAASPNLSNLVVVANGNLQAGNASAFGPTGNHESPDRVINTNGGTVQVMADIHVNNKHLTLSGTGVGGTQGALYAVPGNNSSTRWGLNSWNGSSSPNSSAAFPAISLAGDATIRIDGDWAAQPGSAFLVGHLSATNNTLTKTGGGRAAFDRGLSGLTGLIVQEGAYMPNQASAFGSIQSYTIAAGAAIVNNQNNCFSATAHFQMAAGSIFDINWRGNGNLAGSDNTTYTQNIGYLDGDGVITTGSRGATNVQTLVINGSDSNSVFNGVITVSNAITRFNLTKNGSATLTLNGNNNYSGLTTVNAGALVLNGINSGLGGYQITGGTLGGTGTLASSITNVTGIIEPTPGGTLTVQSSIIGSGIDTVSLSNATLSVGGFMGPDFQVIGTLFMTNSTLEIPLRTLGASASVFTFNVDGNAKLKFSMATPLIGQFPIISYITLGGVAGFSGLSLEAPPGITATLSNNTTSSTIDVVITGIPALTWEGSPAGIWNVGVNNWKGGAIYNEPGGVGSFVVFDDTALGTTTISLGGTVSPEGVTVNNSSLSYTFTGSGNISGAGGIAKQGSGTLIVANSGNDFSGGVNLQQGTLQIGTGGTTGDLGTGSIANQGTLALNRSDSFTLANTVSGNGNITKSGAGTATVPVSGDSTGATTVNAGTLQLAPSATSKSSGDVSGPGAFGVSGSGTLILNGFNNTYAAGTVIGSGTLQFGDEIGAGLLPPAGDISNNGTLATTVSGVLGNDISGTGGFSVLNNAVVILSGANTYAGPTRVLGSLDAGTTSYPAGSALTLGSQNGGTETGTFNYSAGNLVLGGLGAGGNSGFVSTINLPAGGQTITVNGNVVVGNSGPSGAAVGLSVTGTGSSVVVNTNGGVIQLGLGTAGSGVNPDSVVVDFSLIDSFIADLGAAGVLNLGTLDGNPGPPAGATVLNQLKLAASSNSISAGSIVIGAGGRQLVPELRLGAGTNQLNADVIRLGNNGRDGGALWFDTGTGGVRVRALDGVSRASLTVGYGPTSGTGANITNTVTLTGHPADLLLGALVIGDLQCAGVYENSFSFDQGMLDAASTSISPRRNNNANAAFSSSTLNIGGGVASLGPVSLTASAAAGNLNITDGSVTVQNISDTGAGTGTLNVSSATLNVDIQGFGNPVSAPVSVDSFSAAGTVNLGVNGTGLAVGQFPLIQYTGAIGGSGFPALALVSLPAGVTASLSNNTANATVDLVITAAPPATNPNPTNITFSVTGNTLNLSWPPDRLGWTLQTNATAVNATADWFAYPGSSSLTNVAITIDPGKTNVYFRLLKP